MLRTARSLWCSLLVAAAGCNNPTAHPTQPAQTTQSAHGGAATDAGGGTGGGTVGTPAPADTGPVTAPDSAIVTFRGASLRKVLNLMAAGVPSGVALGQIAPGLTPGIGEHGIDIDPDAAFAAAMMAPEVIDAHGSLAMVIAWPLRPGMQLAQDAAAHRGYRDVSPGLYEPVNSDAGAGAAQPCWVARRPPVGWMLVCGPRDALRTAAAYLVHQGTSAPTPETVMDVTVRPEPARRILAAQLGSLESQNPRQHPLPDAGIPREALQAQYDDAHRGLQNTKQIVDDLASLHAVVTADENNYRVHAEADFTHASGSSTRALLSSSIGRHAAVDLLATLPASTAAYLAMGFDMHALAPLLTPATVDPRILQALGPEMARFQEGVHAVADFRAAGERAVGFTSDEGGTTVQVARMPDPTASLTTLRNLAAAVPHTPRASGANPGDYFSVIATPGLPPGSLRLRLGPDPARLPPNAPAEERRFLSRTVLFVPQGDKLTIVEATDPVARFRALATGDRLAVTATPEQVATVHLTPSALGSLLGVPPTADTPLSTEAIQGTLAATRAGDDGGHFTADVVAPITAVNQVRDLYVRVQQAQAQAELQARQAMAAQRRAQQGGGGAGAGAHAPRGTGGLVMPAPGGGADQLPDPNFQLRPPQ